MNDNLFPIRPSVWRVFCPAVLQSDQLWTTAAVSIIILSLLVLLTTVMHGGGGDLENRDFAVRSILNPPKQIEPVSISFQELQLTSKEEEVTFQEWAITRKNLQKPL